MGSDMYMEAQNFRPRPMKVYWEGSELVIQEDYPISGYETVFKRDIDEKNETQLALLRAIGVSKIPDRPAPVVSTWDEMVFAMFNYYGYGDRAIYDKIYEIMKKVAKEGIVEPGTFE